TFLALNSDIVRLPGTDLFEILLESLLAKPELEQISDTAAGQRRASQGIDAMHRIRIVGTNTTFNKVNLRLSALLQIIDLLTWPLCLPGGIVDFSPQPWCLGMLIERQTNHCVGITFQRQKAIERGPQAIAAHGYNHPLNSTIRLKQVDFGKALNPFNA